MTHEGLSPAAIALVEAYGLALRERDEARADNDVLRAQLGVYRSEAERLAGMLERLQSELLGFSRGKGAP